MLVWIDVEGIKEDEKNVEGDLMVVMVFEDKGIKKWKVFDGEDLELFYGMVVELKFINGILVFFFYLIYRCVLCIFVILCLEGLY